jgi:hypothetical protein
MNLLSVFLLFLSLSIQANDCNELEYLYINSTYEDSFKSRLSLNEIRSLTETSQIPNGLVVPMLNESFSLPLTNHVKFMGSIFENSNLTEDEKQEYYGEYLRFLFFRAFATRGIDTIIANLKSYFFGKTAAPVISQILGSNVVNTFSKANGVLERKQEAQNLFENLNQETVNSFYNELDRFKRVATSSAWIENNYLFYSKVLEYINRRKVSPLFISRHDGTLLTNNILKRMNLGDFSNLSLENELSVEELLKSYKCSGHLAMDSIIKNRSDHYYIETGDSIKLGTINYNNDDIRNFFATNDYSIRYDFRLENYESVNSLVLTHLNINSFGVTNRESLKNGAYQTSEPPIEVVPRNLFISNLNSISRSIAGVSVFDIKLSNLKGNTFNNVVADIELEFLNLPSDTSLLRTMKVEIDSNADGIVDCVIENFESCTDSNRDCTKLKECKAVPIANVLEQEEPSVVIRNLEIEGTPHVDSAQIFFRRKSPPFSFPEFSNDYLLDVSDLTNVLYSSNGSTLSGVSGTVVMNDTVDASFAAGLGIDINGNISYFAGLPGYEFISFGTSEECDNESGAYFNINTADPNKKTNGDVFISSSVTKIPFKATYINSSLCGGTNINIENQSQYQTVVIRNGIVKRTTFNAQDFRSGNIPENSDLNIFSIGD